GGRRGFSIRRARAKQTHQDWHADHSVGTRGDGSTRKETRGRGNRLAPDLARILPLLPLKDAASLTPSRARHDLVALADSRKDVPLPQPAAVADTQIPIAE